MTNIFEGYNLLNNFDISYPSENIIIDSFNEPVIDESHGMNLFMQSSPDETIIVNNENKNSEDINNENNKNSDNINNVNNNKENSIIDDPFPFTKGEGLINTLEKMAIKATVISSEKSKNYPYRKKKISFNLIEFFDKNQKKKKMDRRMKPDHILARIKSKFHNVLKDIINKKLFKAGAKELLFEPFPQCFITNVSIEFNHDILYMTYEKLIKSNKNIPVKKNKEKKDKQYKIKKDEYDDIKYIKNNQVLERLNKKEEICKNSEFDKIKNMKYIDILKAYFSSKEFEESIKDLYNKKEKLSYIEKYINKALNYVEYFSFHKKCKNEKENFNPGVNDDNIGKIINIDEGKEES